MRSPDTRSNTAAAAAPSGAQISRAAAATPPSPFLSNDTSPSPALPTLSEREQLKLEFYKTYDVMTGVRIAATLGGFFSLMVFFVVYKTPRRSLGNMSAPAAVRTRFSTSSYVSMNDYQPKSLPGSVLGFNPGWSDVLADRQSHYHHPAVQRTDTYSRGSSFLVVPGVRLSSTGSSSDSSYYLEHHGSVELSLPPAPRPRRCWRRSTIAQEVINFKNEDYPIDINVIQPTPDISPCNSERQLYRQRQSSQWSTCGGRLAAPLATMGHLSASLTDYPESDVRSIGSDSVFFNDDFTSDSSEDAATCESSDTESASSDEVCTTTGHRIIPIQRARPRVEFSQFLQVPSTSIPSRSVSPIGRWGSNSYQPTRRLSSPIPPLACETISGQIAASKLGVPESSVTSLTIPVSLPLRQTGGSEQQMGNSCSRENINEAENVRTTETLF